MDDPHLFDLLPFGSFDHFYPEFSRFAFYLHAILDMKKILQKINACVRKGLDIVARIILILAYFILLFPFAVFVRLSADFLQTRKVRPSWKRRDKIEDIADFLTHQ